jgi:very-short-patch-repair endonuclease
MGGRVLEIKWLRHYKTRYPLAFVVTLGRVLKRELCCREVRVGGRYVDFAFDDTYGRKRAIEIDGDAFHRDIVKEQDRDDYLAKYGWIVLHIPAVDLYRSPSLVQRRALKFLAK